MTVTGLPDMGISGFYKPSDSHLKQLILLQTLSVGLQPPRPVRWVNIRSHGVGVASFSAQYCGGTSRRRMGWGTGKNEGIGLFPGNRYFQPNKLYTTP